MKLSLRKRFIGEFSSRPGVSVFSFTEAKQWYLLNKEGTGTVYGANVYELLINPLLREGLIIRGIKGLYYLTGLPTALESEKIKAPQKLDEFDAYLKEKGIR